MRFQTLLTIPLFASVSLAQSTAFTYQGRLAEAGQPAAGQYDIRFRLFSTAAEGAQVGPTLCVDNAQVTNGLFTASLDFGPQLATLAEPFIEIQVRRDSGLSCASPGGFVLLAPRQLVTPTPLATHAKSAFALDAPDGSPTNAVFVDNDGKVGVGTTAPTSKLEVAAQDAITIRGFQPFVTLRDTNAPNTRSVIQAVGGDFMNFFTEQSLATASAPPLQVRSDGIAVTGDVRLGTSSQLRAIGGEENLRIIRGGVNIGGGVITGSGFTSTQISPGYYRITFNTGFSGLPTTVASPLMTSSDPPVVAMVGSYSSTGVDVEIRRTTDGVPVSWPFRFIVIGLR